MGDWIVAMSGEALMQTIATDLRYCAASRLLARSSDHPRLVKYALKLAFRLEGGEFLSGSAREIMRRRFGVSIGAFSYGECFTPGQFQRNTEVGRYVSIGPGVRTYVRDHPTSTLSTHPYFFNSRLGIIEKDAIPFGRLVIGHDAWLGCNVVVTAHCKRIGIGAVVAAGALVTRNVPDFAVVGGNPAEFLFFRFPPDLKREILDSKWWELSPAQLRRHLPHLTSALPADASACRAILKSIGGLRRPGQGAKDLAGRQVPSTVGDAPRSAKVSGGS